MGKLVPWRMDYKQYRANNHLFTDLSTEDVDQSTCCAPESQDQSMPFEQSPALSSLIQTSKKEGGCMMKKLRRPILSLVAIITLFILGPQGL